MKSNNTEVSQEKIQNVQENGGAKKKKVTFGKVAKTVAVYFLVLILALALFRLTAHLVAWRTLTNNYTVAHIPATYCDKLYEDIQSTLVDYTRPTGLDISVLDGVITKEQVEIDFNSSVRNFHPGDGYTLDTSKLEEKLNLNVTNYLESQEVAVDENSQAAVDEYVKEIGELYRKSIRLPGLDYLASIGESYASGMLLRIAESVLAAVACAFVITILLKNPTKLLRMYSFATGGVAAMALIGPLVALISGFYKRLGITPDYFNDFMVSYINGILAQLLVTAAFWAVISVVFALLSRKMRKQRLRRYKKEELEEE